MWSRYHGHEIRMQTGETIRLQYVVQKATRCSCGYCDAESFIILSINEIKILKKYDGLMK